MLNEEPNNVFSSKNSQKLKMISEKGIKATKTTDLNDAQSTSKNFFNNETINKKTFSQRKYDSSDKIKSFQITPKVNEEKFNKTNLSSLILKNICFFSYSGIYNVFK